MIQLQSDCLLFQTSDGEAIPFSAQAVTIELIGEAASHLDPQLIQHAAQAVLHYFKHDLGRSSVSVGEFSETLERVLRGLGLAVKTSEGPEPAGAVAKFNLHRLASSCGAYLELAFFQRLREELRRQLAGSPRVICFTGLRQSVKLLVGVRRWNGECRRVSGRIVSFLRDSLKAEAKTPTCTLVVK